MVLSALGLMGSLLSFAAQQALAHAFGAGAEIDAYFVGNSLPMLVGGLLSGVMVYQVVPVLKHCRSDLVRDYQDALVRWSMLVGGGVAVCGAIVSYVTLRYYPNAEIYHANHVECIAVVGWIGAWSVLMTAVLTAVCHVNGWFFRVACIGYVPSVLTIAVCYWGSGRGISTILAALAVMAGQVAGVGILAFRLRREIHWMRGAHQRLREITRSMNALPLVLLSMVVFNCFGTFDAFWAARLDQGAVSTLAYVQRIVVSLAGIAVNGAAVVMLPRFAESAAKSDRETMLGEAAQTIRAVLLLMSPIAISVAILARPTIRILFEGGRFSDAETARLAGILPFAVVGMLPMSCCNILFRAHYALRDVRGAALLGTIGGLTYFLVSGMLLRVNGLIGFGIAYIACWMTISALSAVRLWGAGAAFTLTTRALSWGARVTVPLAIAGILATWSRGIIEAEPLNKPLIRGSATVAAYLVVSVVFVASAALVGIREIKDIPLSIIRRKSRKETNNDQVVDIVEKPEL